jgi:prepilin-type N-terminal cleavage/methylation domain-containing protein
MELEVQIHACETARTHGRRGFSLLELMVALGLLTVVLAVTLPSVVDWMRHQRVREAGRSIADLLLLTRSEAIRTGNQFVIFFGNPGTTDPSGNPVQRDGSWVPVLVIDDGPPATANCAIDAGEIRESIAPVEGLSWGAAAANARVPTDEGGAPFGSPLPWDGATFSAPAGAKVNWVLFRPDGVPVSFSGAIGTCGTMGDLGTGGGALYLTNGDRDLAVVLTSLGGVRLHRWQASAEAWSG